MLRANILDCCVSAGNLSATLATAALFAFDPANGAANPAAVQAVVNNLVLDARFFIEGDSSILYNITQVRKKYLYNHTSWNIVPLSQENTFAVPYGIGETCVAKRVREFFKFINDNGLPANQGALDAIQEWVDMKAAIVNFGKANNRRTMYLLRLDNHPLSSTVNGIQFPNS